MKNSVETKFRLKCSFLTNYLKITFCYNVDKHKAGHRYEFAYVLSDNMILGSIYRIIRIHMAFHLQTKIIINWCGARYRCLEMDCCVIFTCVYTFVFHFLMWSCEFFSTVLTTKRQSHIAELSFCFNLREKQRLTISYLFYFLKSAKIFVRIHTTRVS